MMFKNRRFFVIIFLSVITLVLLVVGAVTLYKDGSKTFSYDGYILSTSVDSDEVYYFSESTKYKVNVDNNITFSDTEDNSVSVDPASFVHYANGDIAFLQTGALVNLNELSSGNYISYYNVTSDNIITYSNGSYVVSTNSGSVSISAFAGRISDDKYIIAGSGLSLKIPNETVEIDGDYFELLFIEDGIVKITNEEASYQVTAQGSYIYVSNDIIISLGDGKIYYDGEVKMLLSQITINGDENIDLASDDSSGTGSSTDSSDSSDSSGSGGGSSDGEGDDDSALDGDDTSTDVSTDSGVTSGDGASSDSSDSAKIELVSASVSTTSIDVTLLLNNASYVKGSLKAYLTNVSTGKAVAFTIDTENTDTITLKNGTFDISTLDSDTVSDEMEYHLSPDTEYLLRIVSSDGSSTNQYFQKIFKTNSLGITLNKLYATDSSLRYEVVFDESTNVTGLYLNILGDDVSSSQKISVNDDDKVVEFTGLSSNTNYSVYIDNVTISDDGGSGGITYTSRYNISRIDCTLKKTPTFTGNVISVVTDADNAKFTISLNNISDVDNSITGYTYIVYTNDEDASEVYTVSKNVSTNDDSDDARELVLNLGQISEISSGVSYRCKVIITYNNNEMTRELSIDDGEAFSLKSIPTINWNSDNFVIGKYTASGTISLIDASCTVPIKGRSCSSLNDNYSVKNTTFTLRYYVVGEDETTASEVSFSFDSSTLTYDFDLSGLLSNTNYVMKVYGSYYDDSNYLHENVMIGSSVYFTTPKSDNLSLVINSVYSSNDTDVVNFQMSLDKGTSNEDYEELITSVRINLYSGAYNNSDKLIGVYEISDSSVIASLFEGYNITNGLFTNVTGLSFSGCDDNKICNRNALTVVTNNSSNTLNNSYTIEIESVNVGSDTLVVENPIYTFVLTSSYYLDARIASNSSYKYVVVETIVKGDLSDLEYDELSKSISNLDDLDDDTVVGVVINNNLTDLYVDSAFSYEKAVVNYVVYNNKTGSVVGSVSVDMGNKYQPSSQIIWLDETDTSNGFVRGYNYKIGYTIDFTIDETGLTSDEDVNVVNYDNEVLHVNMDIERQVPVYSYYISTSDGESVTYSYSITDVDNALYDKKPYCVYTVSGEEVDCSSSSNSFNTDGGYHSLVFNMSNGVTYSWGYKKKNINGSSYSKSEIDSYLYDIYDYDSSASYTLVNDGDNKLKIMLSNNVVNERALLYGVTLSSDGVSDYTKIFIASKLDSLEVLEGDVDSNGESVYTEYKYIAIDYADISKFLGKDIDVSVSVYYDSGLVGLNQSFLNGLVIRNITDNKYLNIYNSGSSSVSVNKVESVAMGVNFIREGYDSDSNSIYLYNLVINGSLNNSNNSSSQYSNDTGASFYTSSSSVSGNIGIKYSLSFSNTGLVITDEGGKSYSRYNFNSVNLSSLSYTNDSDKSYRFDSITPKIKVSTSATINSLVVKFTASGVYGQFDDDYIYVDVYSDDDCNNKIGDTYSVSVSVVEGVSGYTATIDNLELDNLDTDTTYYFRVYAYLSGSYVQLYDDSSSSSYVVKTYSAKTLGTNSSGVSEILRNINFSVSPSGYNTNTGTSVKTLSWSVNFKSTSNFKVLFGLYRVSDGVQVNFDGTLAYSCDNTLESSSSSVVGCYVVIGRDAIEGIGTSYVSGSYVFGDGNLSSNNDSFVLGDGYYELVVYAVPYYSDSGSYDWDRKVVLYDDVLNSTSGTSSPNIKVNEVVEANISYNKLSSGYDSDDGYYVDYVPKVEDDGYTIRYGTYKISLYDDSNNLVDVCSISDGVNESYVTDGCTISASALGVNYTYRFSGLSSNTLYSVELEYDVYGNNVSGVIDNDKVNDYYVYTPSSEAGIRIGTVSASMSSSTSLTLVHSGSVNLGNIYKVIYTISLVGGKSSVTGYKYSSDGIFSTVSNSSNLTMKVDLESDVVDSSSFTFSKGNSYIIKIQYYYSDSEEPLTETISLDT